MSLDDDVQAPLVTVGMAGQSPPDLRHCSQLPYLG